MCTGQIDGTGNDLYPEIQVLDGETVLLLFHKDSSKLKIRECSFLISCYRQVYRQIAQPHQTSLYWHKCEFAYTLLQTRLTFNPTEKVAFLCFRIG